MQDSNINPYFNDIKSNLISLPEPRLEHALQFVNNLDYIDKTIVGTTSCNELKEIVSALKANIEILDYNKFSIDDERFILPQNWRLR